MENVLQGVQYEEAAEPPARRVTDIPDGGTLQERLKGAFDVDWEWSLRDNPEFATQAGFHERDDKLQDLGPQAFDDRQEHNKEVAEYVRGLLAEAEAATADKPGLSDADRLYAKLFIDALETETAGIEVGCHLAPINSIGIGGVHENFLELLEWMKFEDETDFHKYLNRLMAFPAQVSSFCDLLAYGSGMRGSPASKQSMEKVPGRLEELINSDLPMLRAPLEGKQINEELREQLEQAFHHCFKGGVARLQEFVSEFYFDRARESPGIAAVRNGDKVYEQCLRFHTTTTKSAQEIHDLGLKEVARIEQRFQQEVLDKVGFKGSFIEFSKSLKDDKQHFWETEDALMDGYKALVVKITALLPKYFNKLPKATLEVVKKTGGPAAYYFAGSADGSRPGRFYVNTSRLDERPKYEMTALALHEGVPGHHLQGSLAIENEELPNFMRYIEDRRYEFGSARRPLYAGYLEGWALYCEKLGEEMGLYETPYDLFGRLSMEMMRAVRLVVDTGIHAFGWSVDKASKYMEEKTGMATAECVSECSRYSAWPGQACAYKVGQLAIEEMRETAEKRLGEKFDLAVFHEVLLNRGAMPLDVLAERVDEWIEQTCK